MAEHETLVEREPREPHAALIATPDEGVSYGNARCQCGHLSNAHACEQGDTTCSRCGCDRFIWDRTPIPPPVATPAPAGEARLREAAIQRLRNAAPTDSDRIRCEVWTDDIHLVLEALKGQQRAETAEAEVARLRIMAAKITHCDHCGSDWVDNGINTGCSCREVARLTAENERLRQIAQSAVDMHFKSEAR